jgi:poly-gamma-glutamate synthesis protein (capsule biosynthesis protein)
MSGPGTVRGLFLLLLLLPGLAAGAPASQFRLLFTGDILLARETAREIDAKHGASPWADLAGTFAQGAVGDPEKCLAPPEFCFADSPRFLPLLKQAGFTAIGSANNHSGDLGGQGRRDTSHALAALGIAALGSDDPPGFIRLGDRTIALVALNLVPARDGGVDAVPSWPVAQKLRLARAVADWVIVSVHWGKELADWVVPEQRSQAEWLVAQGADVIIGAHPHVVQTPGCVNGRPVFFSLGNHVFDQKYAATKHGLIAECRIAGDRLTCDGIPTETPSGSSFPRLAAATPRDTALAACSVPAGTPLTAEGRTLRAWAESGKIALGPIVLEGKAPASRWRTVPRALVGAEIGSLAPGKPPMLFTLERHASSIDAEDGPRPYVYDITPRGLIARWRGSALAWPLLDARLIADAAGHSYLCALHRGDSFIMLDPAHLSRPRTQLYQWNGFGFSGLADPDLTPRCNAAFVGDATN